MKAKKRNEMLEVRRHLVTQYHALSDVLCSPNLDPDTENAARQAFHRVDEAICAINEQFGILP